MFVVVELKTLVAMICPVPVFLDVEVSKVHKRRKGFY
jgi:hypothetical protein